jgi:hypothetical protein
VIKNCLFKKGRSKVIKHIPGWMNVWMDRQVDELMAVEAILKDCYKQSKNIV